MQKTHDALGGRMRFKGLKLGGGLIFLLGIFHQGIAQPKEKLEPMPLSKEKQADCIPVSIIEPTKHKPRSFVLQAPGRYCLMEDLTFSYNSLNPLELIAGGSGTFGYLTPGVELDLGGHTLRSNLNGVEGLVTSGVVNGLARSTIIKNGTLVISGYPISAQNTYKYLWYDKPYEITPKGIPGTDHLYQAARDGYISTQITLENLDITTNHNAIFLEGNDNIIRNCKIRVKPGANAIQIFGNNVQILNNEIIVEANARDAYADKKLWAREKLYLAPIMIRDGDNALIAGNTITIQGETSSRPKQAISLRDAQHVRIENNQFIGFDATSVQENKTPLVTIFNTGSATLTGNTLKGNLITPANTLPDSTLCMDPTQALHTTNRARQDAPPDTYQACNKRITDYRAIESEQLKAKLKNEEIANQAAEQKRLAKAEAERIRRDPVRIQRENQKSYWAKSLPPCLETGTNQCERTIKAQYCWQIKPEDHKDWAYEATSCEHGWTDTGALAPGQAFDIRSPFVNTSNRMLDAPQFIVNFACVWDAKLKKCLAEK